MDVARDRILVVDDNKLILKLVDEKLREAGFSVVTAATAEQALKILETELPSLIVSDVMMPGMDGYEFCRLLKANPRTAPVPVIMLTARSDIKEKVRGFEAGADDYIVKPFEPTELALRIRALLARASATRQTTQELARQGRIISVFSLRGGIGKSSLAVNLAISLAQLWGIEVGLVDLALESDQDGLLLNVRNKHSWLGLAEKGPDDLDEELVMGHLAPHECGVRLLAAPPAPASASLITPKLVTRVLPILRSRFEYVVLDLSASFSDTNLVGMDNSDLIVLMMAPELSSLKAARASLEVFESLGYGHERIATVLNWVFPKRGLLQRNIEDALSVTIDLVISNDQAAFLDAINGGVPLVMGAPNAKPSQEIQRFAYQISAMDMQARMKNPPSETLQRVKAGLGRS